MDLLVGYLVTGTVWGITNAYMEQGTKQSKDDKGVAAGVKMFANLGFLLPFLLNQAASIYNNFLVAKSDLSIAVPAVNCVTFIVTFITQRLLAGQSLIDGKFFGGSCLVMAGMYLCMTK